MKDRKRISHFLTYGPPGGDRRVVVWDTVDIRVGRSKTQDIVISDPEVSREHACFRREEGHHLVEDLETGIGTWVNGERIAVHELQPGDVVRIGPCELGFGRTDQEIRPGGNTCFASDLKSGMELPTGEAGGRTMLGFDLGDSAVFSAPTSVPELEVARAVSADGTLEDVDSDNPLGLSIHPDIPGVSEAVRDLDLDLEPPDPAPPEDTSSLGLSDLYSIPGTESSDAATGPTIAGKPRRMTLVLEVEAGSEPIADLVAGLYGQQFGNALLRVRIKKPDES